MGGLPARLARQPRLQPQLPGAPSLRRAHRFPRLPTASLAQQVARGLNPPVPGVSMEQQAAAENRIREAEAVQRYVETERKAQMREFEERER